MKPCLVVLFLASAVGITSALADRMNPLEKPWEDIVRSSTTEGKCLYVAFLGDGWSVASNRFSKKVLDSEAFKEFAARNLVYCPVLARSNPPMGKEMTARLQALVVYFDMKTYPTLFLLAPDGTELLRHGYKDISGEEYVGLLEAILPKKEC